jgi:hypothetical protein
MNYITRVRYLCFNALVGMYFLCSAGTGRLEGASLDAKECTQWSPYVEWTLPNPSWTGNAFDLRAEVEFAHPASGEKRKTDMFYAGGTTWAFRFTGNQTGAWHFTTSSDDADLDRHSGKVIVEENSDPDANGFLKSFDGKWGWDGSETAFVPQLVMWDYIAGDGNPRNVHKDPQLVDRLIEQFIDGHGFTGFHISVIGGRWFDLDAATDRVESAMTEPDSRTFEALEMLIVKTHAAGGMVHLWPWGDHQRAQTPRSLKGGIGGMIDLRLQRYIAARLGPIPGWSMGYGFDLDEWATADEVRSWHDTMHQFSGWPHLLGARPEGPNHGSNHSDDATWSRGLDYSSYEHHRPTYEVYLAAIRAAPDQPVMSEDRFRIREGRYPEKDYSPELLRRGLYNSTMAGGVANIWGIHPDLGPKGVFPNKNHINTYSIFFNHNGRFLADMEPAPELSLDGKTRVLLSPAAQSLVLYGEDTRSVRVDLGGRSGAMPAVAINTRKSYSETLLGDLQPNAQTIQLPEVSDWVVAVGTFHPTATSEVP